MVILQSRNTVEPLHNMIIFLQNTCTKKLYSIAHPRGWAMECYLQVQTLLSHCMQYPVVTDHVAVPTYVSYARAPWYATKHVYIHIDSINDSAHARKISHGCNTHSINNKHRKNTHNRSTHQWWVFSIIRPSGVAMHFEWIKPTNGHNKYNFLYSAIET